MLNNLNEDTQYVKLTQIKINYKKCRYQGILDLSLKYAITYFYYPTTLPMLLHGWALVKLYK